MLESQLTLMWSLSGFILLVAWLRLVVAGSDWLLQTPAQSMLRNSALYLSRPCWHAGNRERWHGVVLLLLSLIAMIVRLWDFGELPGGFNQDGAMAAVDAKALAEYGTDRFGMRYPVHFTAWGYGQMSVMLSYMMAPFIKLFGMNALVCRLPILLLSLAGLAALYHTIRRLFGREAALIVLAFAAINPWHIMQSRWALDCNVLPHLFLLGMYWMLRALDQPRFLLLAMSMFALCMYSYGVAFLSVPPFLLLAYLVLWRAGLSMAWLAGGALIYGLLSWPIFWVMLINVTGWETVATPLFTMPHFPHSVRANDIVFFAQDVPQQFLANFQSMLNVTFLQRRDLPWNALDKFGSVYLFSGPLMLLGGLCLLNSIAIQASSVKIRAGRTLLLLGLLAGLWTGLAVNGVNINRINLVFYFSLSLVGLGLWQVVAWLPRAGVVLFAVYSVAFGHFVADYFFGDYRQQIAQSFMHGFADALVSEPASQVDTYYITTHSQYRGARPVSEILTLFHLEIDAEYFQDKSQGETSSKPYSQRYRYLDFLSEAPSWQPGSLYVLHASEKKQFSEQRYQLKAFGQFYAARPRLDADAASDQVMSITR